MVAPRASTAPTVPPLAPTEAAATTGRRKSKGFSLFSRARSPSSARPQDKDKAAIETPAPEMPTAPVQLTPLCVLDDDALAGPRSASVNSASDSNSFAPAGDDLDGPLEEPSPLFRSLALLDSRLASMESLGFPLPTSPVESLQPDAYDSASPSPSRVCVPGSGDDDGIASDGDDDGDDDDSIEGGRALRSLRTTSLSAFQLPATGRDSGLFGTDVMLWKALGLSPEEELDYSGSLDHHPHARMSLHAKTPSVDSLQSISTRDSGASQPEECEQSQSSASTVEEISEDIFNLSEFPAFDELPSFSSSETPDANPDAAVLNNRRISIHPPPSQRPPSIPSLGFIPPTPRPESELLAEPTTRTHSPASDFVDANASDEDHHEASHDRLAAFMLANLGLGSDSGLAGLGFSTGDDEFDAPQAHSRTSSSLSHGLAPDNSSLAYAAQSSEGGDHGDHEPAFHPELEPFEPELALDEPGLSLDDPEPDFAHEERGATSEEPDEPEVAREDEQEPMGTAVTTPALAPLPVESARLWSASSLQASGHPVLPLTVHVSMPPSGAASLTTGNDSHAVTSPSIRVRRMQRQGSLPAIFRHDSSTPDRTLFPESDLAEREQPQEQNAPPRARAMELGSPVTLNPSTFNGGPFSHLGFGNVRGDSPDGRTRSPSAASFSSSHQDLHSPVSGTTSPRTPKSPTELYGASLGQLRMTDETEFPIWDQPMTPVSRSQSPAPTPPRVPSPAPRLLLRPMASTKSLRDDASSKPASRRMSFSLRRRKSDIGLSVNTSAKEQVPALPSPPPLLPLPPVQVSPIVVEVPVVAEPTPPEARMRRKSRLSLFIPRFGKKQPPVPGPTKAASLVAAIVAAQDESQPNSLQNTPNLMASPGGFSLASPTFPSTPTSADAPAAQSFFSDDADSKARQSKSSPFGDEFAFLGSSPTPRGTLSLRPDSTIRDTDDINQPITLNQFVTRPTRSSSVFPQTDIDYALRPLPSPAASNDIIVFPVLTGVSSPTLVDPVRTLPVAPRALMTARPHAPAPAASVGSVATTRDADSESDDDEDGKEADDEVPLGSIPGALKMQKSLRLTARKPKAAAALDKMRAQRLAAKVSSAPVPKSDAAGLSATVPPVARSNGARDLVGHSLLPHSDEAVFRRGAVIPRSPSLPLTPEIAQSTLTIDTATAGPPARPAKPIKSHTMDVVPSFSKARPSLSVNTTGPPRRASNDDTPLSSREAGSSSAPPRPPPHQQPPQAPSQRVPVPALHGSSAAMERGLNSSSSSSASVSTKATEHRVFINNHTTHILVTVGTTTRCGEIVAGAKARGALVGGSEADGGWALFEICRSLGVERPIREYELIDDVVKSWDQDSNILIIRRTVLWPILSANLRPQPSAPRSDWVQFEVKKGKWAKRFLTLKDGAVSYSKSDKGKDPTPVCQLVAFDVYFVAPHVVERVKAPKPFVFALKSLLPRAHYEKPEDYCYLISVKTSDDLHAWVKALTEARNIFARQRETAVLGKPVQATAAPSASAPAPAPLLEITSRTATAPRSVPSRPPPSSLSLSVPLSTPALGNGKPTNQGALQGRPSASVWQGMNEASRTAWLREAEREARANKASFLEFGSEPTPPAGAVGLGRAKSTGSALRRG